MRDDELPKLKARIRMLFAIQRRPPLPELNPYAATNERDPDYIITVLGLVLYVAAVAGVLVLLGID